MLYNHTGQGLPRYQWDVADYDRLDKTAIIFGGGGGVIAHVNLEQSAAAANIALILAAQHMVKALRHITKQYMVERAIAEGRTADELDPCRDIVCVKEALHALSIAGYSIPFDQPKENPNG